MGNSNCNSGIGKRKEAEEPELRLQVQELLFDLVNSRVRGKIKSTMGMVNGMNTTLIEYVNLLDEQELQEVHLKLAEAYLHEVDFLVSQGHLLDRGKENSHD
ncbi:MAG: hypothetical protein NUV44_07240 [Candidatus Scalindua sp.]|nr:hypothetical protein [Candidatus Scalindua sp.]